MAKYSDIKGFTVQTLSTDTIASQIAGGAWASGNSMNTARQEFAGFTDQSPADSGLVVGGSVGSPPGNLNETWNGTSWTEASDLNTYRINGGGMGASNTSAVVAGGGSGPSRVANAESWDGSSWTETADLNTGRELMAGF